MKRTFKVVKDFNDLEREMAMKKGKRTHRKLRSKKYSKELNSNFEHGITSVKSGRKAKMPGGMTGKLLMAGKPEVIVRHDNCAHQSSTRGAEVICTRLAGSQWSGTTFTSNTILPIRLYELTAVPTIKADVGTGAGNIVQPQLDYYVSLDGNLTPVVTEEVSARRYDTWEKGIGDSTGFNDSNYGGNRKLLFMRYVEARLNLYQVRKTPLKYTIMMVQFKDRQLVPEQVKTGGQIAMSNSAKNFYTRLIKPYVSGPISSSDSTLLKAGVKILQKKTVVMPERNDADADTVKKTQVVMRYNMDQLCSFEWSNGLVSNATNGIAVPFNPSPETGIVRNITWNERLKPEKRVYLIVLCESYNLGYDTALPGPFIALNTNTLNSVTVPQDYAGSYDIVLRAKYNPL